MIDFTGMTDRDLFEFFHNYSGGACGRFTTDQLNRSIAVEQPRRTGWFRYVLTLLMPAMFLANRSAAQGEVKKTSAVCMPVKKKKLREAPEVKMPEIKLDHTISYEVPDTFFNVVVYGGFVASEVVETSVFHQFRKFFGDTLAKNSLTIFPNPVTPGGMLRATFNAKRGSYYIQFLDANGFMAQEQQLDAWNEKVDMQVRVSRHILPGLYTVLLTDVKRRKLSSQKLIVQ